MHRDLPEQSANSSAIFLGKEGSIVKGLFLIPYFHLVRDLYLLGVPPLSSFYIPPLFFYLKLLVSFISQRFKEIYMFPSEGVRGLLAAANACFWLKCKCCAPHLNIFIIHTYLHFFFLLVREVSLLTLRGQLRTWGSSMETNFESGT